MPRQFLNEASVISLIYAAEQEKISEKKEEKLRKEWLKAQDEKESPLKRLERENKRLQDRTIRLDFENDQVFADRHGSRLINFGLAWSRNSPKRCQFHKN